MKNFSVLSLLFWLILASHHLYGQAVNQTESFPSYQQIKAADSEIVDYVSSQGKSGFYTEKTTINLFDYPDGTVTYILNGKSTTDGNFAKKLLSQKKIQIDKISIELPTENRKQIIRIDYTTNK